jgi:hypothetical protein
MSVDARKPATVADQLYKKGRVIADPAGDFPCMVALLTIFKELPPFHNPGLVVGVFHAP